MADDNGEEGRKEQTTAHNNNMDAGEIPNNKSIMNQLLSNDNIQLHGGCGLGGVTIISGTTPKHGDITSKLKEEGKFKYFRPNYIRQMLHRITDILHLLSQIP